MPLPKRDLELLIIAAAGAAALTAVGAYYYVKGMPSAPPPAQGCTLEALICPDGSAVGRTGPNCEFAPCPTAPPAVCTDDAKVCPDGSTVGRQGPDCEFAPCPGVTGCTKEAKICPDGTAVGRVPPSCRFAPCPQPSGCPEDVQRCPDGSYVGRMGPNCDFTPCPPYSACTLEAKICPDGSTVGRVPPDCEFSPCPPSACSGGCQPGYVCIPECGPPVVSDSDPPPKYYCEREDIAAKRTCPICLASETMIATPHGDVRVSDLRAGMPVWTLDARGKKTVAPVTLTSRTPAPAGHRVVRLALADGRRALVSPGHPTADGRLVGDLHAGDAYDGSLVVSAELVLYGGAATHDLLPAGETGLYWADGILLGSTLR